jgi:glycosyltransferase involved in cell wall biosynthesis
VIGAIERTGLQSDDVHMPGLVATDDLPGLYRAASLFIFPSLMEGFGLTPAEAVASGTPVLSADNSSLPEVIRNAECRFDAKDIESLTVKLVAAAKDEKQFSSELCEDFTEPYGIKRYLGLIHTVAERE